MPSRILIIGFTSQVFDVGSSLVRSAKELDCSVAVSNIQNYQNSMKYLWGKLIYHINNRRSIEWGKFNRDTVEIIQQFKPEIIIVTGIISLTSEVFQAAHKSNSKIVNYLTDDPWNPYMCSSAFFSNLILYDYIFSTKKAIINDLVKAGVKKVKFLPFAFDPLLHHKAEKGDINLTENEIPDICFIGTADEHRQGFFHNFPHRIKGKFGLYGVFWERDHNLKRYSQAFLYGDAYRRMIQSCKINLGLVRRANRDGHAMRSYEIPACGGVGIFEDTLEHRELFPQYPEYGFFKSSVDLVDKCNWLLDHPKEREEMATLGYQIITKQANTYSDRLKTIIETLTIRD